MNKARLTLLSAITVALVIVVFSAEGILTVLRVRSISATVQVQGSSAPALVATAAVGAASNVSTLTIAPSNSLDVTVIWDYRIGPRFPDTLIHLEAIDQNNEVVAADDYKITCADATLTCAGTQILSLTFGVKTPDDKKKARANWPEGSFTLRGTWIYAGVNKFHDLIGGTFAVQSVVNDATITF